MGLYLERVYPRLIAVLGNPPPIREIRRQLIPQAQGVVLEIGVGTGANLAHYDPTSVEKLYALEPNPEMIRRAERPKPLTYCCWGVAERAL